MYGIVLLRPIWALNSNSTARPIAPISCYPKPQPKPTQATGPNLVLLKGLRSGQLNISTHLVSAHGPRSANHSLCNKKMFGHTIPCIPNSALGSIAAEHIYWSGNQFQGHSYHAPLPPKHPLTTDDIGPPIALTMEVIMVSPLISSYKYEKLKKGRGCWEVLETA